MTVIKIILSWFFFSVFPKSTLVNSEHAALNDAGGPGCVSCDKVMSVFLELKERVDSIDNLIEQQLADLVAENAGCKGKLIEGEIDRDMPVSLKELYATVWSHTLRLNLQ